MKHDIESLLGRLGKLALSDRERASVRARLAARFNEEPAFSPAPRGFFMRLPRLSPVAFGLALALSCSGVAFAAQQAVPGDTLYGVKVNVTEKIAEALTFSAAGKAALDASFAKERLAEAAALSSEGKLTPSARADLSMRLVGHLEHLNADVGALKERGDEAAAASTTEEIRTAVSAQAAVLRDLGVDVSIQTNSENSNSAAPEPTAPEATSSAGESATSTPRFGPLRARERVEAPGNAPSTGPIRIRVHDDGTDDGSEPDDGPHASRPAQIGGTRIELDF